MYLSSIAARNENILFERGPSADCVFPSPILNFSKNFELKKDEIRLQDPKFKKPRKKILDIDSYLETIEEIWI